MALADVVEGGGGDNRSIRPVSLGVNPGLVAMSLIGYRLRQEETQLGRGQPSLDLGELVVVEVSGGRHREKTPNQMASRAGHRLS